MSAPPANLNLASISGPGLLGYMLNWGLFGVLSVQVYFYALAFPRDRLMTKLLVGGVYVLEMVQTILLTHDAFSVYAIHYGDPSFLGKLQLAPLSVPIVTGLVSVAVQLYYANVLRVLSKSKLLCFVVAVLALTQCAADFVQGVQSFIIQDIAELSTKAFASGILTLSASLACDLTIAVGMSYVLMKKDTRLPETHTLITKLVRAIVETGCLTALTATVAMILFIAVPDKPYFSCVVEVLSKLYSNSLLAILNSRIRIEGVHKTPSVQMMAGSTLAFYDRSETARSRNTAFSKKERHDTHVVNVERTTETWLSSADIDIPMTASSTKASFTSRGSDLAVDVPKLELDKDLPQISV